MWLLMGDFHAHIHLNARQFILALDSLKFIVLFPIEYGLNVVQVEQRASRSQPIAWKDINIPFLFFNRNYIKNV